jgi:transposase
VVVIGGAERKAHFFVLDLPHSDGCYVPYPAAVSEAWVDGHVHVFACPGLVAEKLLAAEQQKRDNMTGILEGAQRARVKIVDRTMARTLARGAEASLL